MKKLWELYEKYREVLLYLIFGGLTTLTNIVVFAVCARGLHLTTVISNGLALGLSILFAYITNKLFVFQSRKETFYELLKEFVSFIGCRLGTGVLDMLIMWFSVDVMKYNDMVMKVISNIIVIVLNYVLSKLVIFSKERK